jgi:hypothetical protein
MRDILRACWLISREGEKAMTKVLRVGDGRGFVVTSKGGLIYKDYVITAAHCLPERPPTASITYTWERTFKDILAPLEKEPRVWAECLFFDPVADIAVLGSPDYQDYDEQSDAYDLFIETLTALPVSDVKGEIAELLPLEEGQPMIRAVVGVFGRGSLWLSKLNAPVVGGMSGSPILMDGSAVGVLVASNETANDSGPNPRLVSHLPGWLLAELREKPRAGRSKTARIARRFA